MTKREQQVYANVIIGELKKNGISIGFFLKKIGFSRTHWYFIKNGERKLTDEKIEAISKFRIERLMFLVPIGKML